MSLNTSNIVWQAICGGCLSTDRNLTEIVDVEYRKIFHELLESIDIMTQLMLCWECNKMLKNCLNFKLKVKLAQNQLLNLVMIQPVFSLSRMKIKKSDNLCISPSNYTTDTKTNDNELINSDIGTDDVKCTLYPTDCGNSDIEPLAFIKVENSDNEVINDFEDEYLGIPDDEVKQEKPKKKKLKRRNKTKESFDESDEEPLTKKKIDTEDNEKTKIDIPRKLDRRKNPGPKREKPAGVVDNKSVRRKLEQLNVREGQIEMVVLSWDEVLEERQLALSSVAFTRHDYRCNDCIIGFNHRSKLDNHMKKHDPISGNLVCDICNVHCKDNNAYSAHRRRHRVRWRCKVCMCAWSRASVCADHYSREHGAPPPTHTCNICGHTETSLGRLRSHVQEHSERQKCELCGKTFKDKTSLKTHLFIHKGEKDYECNRCGKKFLFKKAMEIHMITHDASSLLYCYDCDMNFKNQMSYYQHMKYNLKHVDPAKLKYACKLCDKKFVKAARLEEHNMAVHLKMTPIRCTVTGCEFACSSRAALRTHTRMQHRNARALRNHVCHACGKAYTTKKTLEGHVRSHTGERPFECSRCPSTFGYEAALYNHNRLVHVARRN